MNHHRARKTSTEVATYQGPSSIPAKVSGALAKSAPKAHSADGRTFHLDDYRRASQMVKAMREGKQTRAKQQWVDALAASMAAVFEADSQQFGVPFSPSYFIGGTK